MKNIKISLFCIMMITATAYCFANEDDKETQPKELTTLQKVNRTAEVVGNLGNCVVLAGYIYNLGQTINSCIRKKEQNAQQQLLVNRVDQQLKLMTLSDDFRTCLIERRMSTQKSKTGIPSQCTLIASDLILIGSQEEVEKMTAIFNARSQWQGV